MALKIDIPHKEEIVNIHFPDGQQACAEMSPFQEWGDTVDTVRQRWTLPSGAVLFTRDVWHWSHVESPSQFNMRRFGTAWGELLVLYKKQRTRIIVTSVSAKYIRTEWHAPKAIKIFRTSKQGG